MKAFLFFASLIAAFGDDRSFEIDPYLKALLNFGAAADSCAVSGNSSSAQIECGKPFNAKVFCENAVKASGCASPNCWNPRRELSPAQKAELVQKAKTIFRQLVSDSYLQEMCCGRNKECGDRFKQTRLSILKATSEDDSTGHYDAAEKTVKTSETRVFGCENRECMEYLILHELGHACQHVRSGDRHVFNFKQQVCFVSDSSAQDFNLTLGIRTSECVFKGLKAKASGNPRSCFSSWAMEAFAESVFSARFTRPAHWAWSCTSAGDEDHAPLNSFLSCLFERAAPKSSLCSK